MGQFRKERMFDVNQIAVIGTGYVGLVSGACLSEFGLKVVCWMWTNPRSLSQAGDLPIYEPGLEEIVVRNEKSGRLSFTTDIGEAVEHATVVFIAVGTPPPGGRLGGFEVCARGRPVHCQMYERV